MRKFSLITFSFFIAFTSLSVAATSDWVAGDEIYVVLKGAYKSKKIPTAIKCKAGAARSGFKRILLKVSYGPNPSGAKWIFDWGKKYGKAAAKAKRNGLKLIASDSYTTQSGLLTKCGVWSE